MIRATLRISQTVSNAMPKILIGRKSIHGLRSIPSVLILEWFASGLRELIEERRAHASELALQIMQRADECMYEAKNKKSDRALVTKVRAIGGQLITLTM
jgi:hypothetical protein